MSFLFEIGCEEIPARFVRDAAEQFATKVGEWFASHRIEVGTIHTYATPRRLAVVVDDVAEKQADRSELLRGPAAKIAKQADGSWSKAAMGFARKNGVELDELEIREEKGVAYIYATKQEIGQPTQAIIAEQFATVLASLTFPKTMRWEATRTKFIRPVRWLVCLLHNTVVPVSFAGITADRVTRGHRFLGKEIALQTANDYAPALREQFVLVDMDERQAEIQRQLQQLQEDKGWDIPIDAELLEEVTQLVEFPTVVSGTFDDSYLQLPKEVLITTMREHQRYFPVQNAAGNLLPYFVTIRNGDQHSLALVSQGNEKVLRARLADAQFFFVEDQKLTITDAQQALANIIYQEALGSMAARVERGKALALSFADLVSLRAEERADLERAASIAKFDQATQIVGEFPELEGYMGSVYARLQGESPAVARALYEQVLPRFADDEYPASTIGLLLALADRFDSLATGFGIGLPTSGSQDPYGFRKKATAIIQLLQHSTLRLSLTALIQIAAQQTANAIDCKQTASELEQELIAFFQTRLKYYLHEQQVRYDVVDAVLQGEITDLLALEQKSDVLTAKLSDPTFKEEVEGFTRVANLAVKADDRVVNVKLFTDDAEIALARALQQAQTQFVNATDQQAKYDALASMAPTIHLFFDKVMVMVDEEDIRSNRLALLRDIHTLTSGFAGFEYIVFGKDNAE